MNWKTVAVALIVSCLATVSADVVIDNMDGTGKKSTSGGYWFVTQDGKSDNTITEQSSSITFPSLSRAFSFYDLSLAPKPETGKVAYLSGTIGSKVEFPFLAMGFNLTELKDTLDLSTVTHFAFRARGVGAWGFKIKSPVADNVATAMGKDPGQVDWRYDFSTALDSVTFKWVALTPAELAPTTKAFRDTLTAKGLSIQDGMKKVYQVQWGTVGYKSTDAGAKVWLQIDDFVALGGVNKVGISSLQPAAGDKAAILAASNSPVIMGLRAPRAMSPRMKQSARCDLVGRSTGVRMSNGMTTRDMSADVLLAK